MKREIEFRGRTAKGEWVYGYHAKFRNCKNEVYSAIIPKDEETNEGYMEDLHPVTPETVGQYTGIKDKNGKKVYEGDKVKFTSTPFSFSHIGDVCFDKGSFCILYESYAQKELHRIGKTDKWQDMGASGTITYSYEVIGNIFDKESDNEI